MRDPAAVPPPGAFREIALVYLQLGWTTFGGPAAHVAMMRREMVEQRQWVSEQEFVDLFGAANLIPGPSSTELAILLGYRRGGWRALIVAGLLFILPAMLLVFAFAWAYVRFGSLPAVANILYGIKPVVIAIIATALWGLRKTAVKGVPQIIAGLGALVLLLLGVNPLLIVVGGGLFLVPLVLGRRLGRRPLPDSAAWRCPRACCVCCTACSATRPHRCARAAQVAPPGYHPLTLFLTFLKIGAIIYGSGYVLLAFLRDDFVTRLHWLTSKQLIDAVAVGSVFTTATFIGYIAGGWGGGLVATLGIFLPAFVFCAIVLRIVPLTKRWPLLRSGLDGVNAAAIGLMAAVTLQLAKAAIVDVWTAALAAVALALLLRFKWNSAWFVLAGAVAGLLIKAV